MSSIPNSNTQDRQGDVSLTINSTLDPINPDHEKKLQFEVEALSYKYPEGGLSAWTVVAGASMMMACTFGMMGTVGVLQSYWETHQLQIYSSSQIGWISSLFVFLNLLLGVQVGPLFDRYGPRWVMLIGSILYTISIFLLGSCQKYYQFLLCLGVLGGISSALVSTPCLAVISHWFNRRRGTATGIAMAGSSLGGILFPIILRPALDNLGWAWALRILGFIFFFFLAIGNMCIKSRFSVKTSGGAINLKCFADSRFIWATIGSFFGEIVVFTSLGLIPSYALAQGFGSETGIYLLSVFNAGSGLGRWLAGLASDHYGRFNTISAIIAITTLCIFVLWYPFGRLIAVLYPFVCLLGFGTGGILSLTPVCIGQLCKTEDFGQWVGTCYFVTSFGSLVGIPIGGLLLQEVGASNLVAFLGGVLVIALIAFVVARWACLGYHWKWFTIA